MSCAGAGRASISDTCSSSDFVGGRGFPPGILVDYIFLNKKVGNVSPLITQREADFQDNKLPYVYYDKRLLNICQVPQSYCPERNSGEMEY